MNALPMNALGTFDPRDAMERWTQQQQNAQQNALMSSGGDSISAGPAMPFQMPPLGMQPAQPQPQPQQPMPMPRLPFGGFRANGGPVRPGMAYVVGERGPELMVPSVPGTIVPNGGSPQKPMPINPLDAHVNRINARGDQQLAENAKFYGDLNKDWQTSVKTWENFAVSDQAERAKYAPGSAEERAANAELEKTFKTHQNSVEEAQRTGAEARKYRALVGTGQGWKDLQSMDAYSQRAAEQRMAEMRAQRTQPPATGGVLSNERINTVRQQNALMAQNQRDIAATPQSAPQPVARAGDTSRVAQSPMNRPYAELAGGTGSLANRGVRQIGRSINDPQRAAEIAMRRLRQSGDVVGAARLAQTNAFFQDRMGRSMPMMAPPPMMPMAARERLAPVLDANTGMPVPPPMDAPSPDVPNVPANEAPLEPAPPPQSFEQAFQQSPLGNSGPPPMSTAMQVPFDTPPEMMNQLNQGSFAGVYGRAPAPYEAMPIPGTGMMGILRDGKTLGQLVQNDTPKPTGYAPVQGVPGLMVPTGPGADKLPPMQQTPNPGWSVTGQPKTKLQPMPGKTELPQFTKADDGRMFWIEPKPGGGYVRRFVEDADGDGIPDAAQGGAGAAKVPAWKSLMQ